MSTTEKKRIGLFDSGVGGLSILRKLSASCPQDSNAKYRFVYLADSARCPYGNRSSQEISTYVKQITRWLEAVGIDRIVMACNTSAAVAYELAQQSVSVPVHDLISTASRYAAGRFEKIGVVATSTTCSTKAFSRSIKTFNSEAKVIEVACPDLVPLVESGELTGPRVLEIISKYTDQLKNVDALIFGCTHFPFLSNSFRQLMNDKVEFIDPAVHLSQELFGSATKDTAEFAPALYKQCHFYTTGNLEDFCQTAAHCLNLEKDSLLDHAQELPLSELIKMESFTAQEPDINLNLTTQGLGSAATS